MQLILGLFLVVVLVSVSADLDLDSRVFKGMEASDGDFPYQVALYISIFGLYFFNCGGSLISETFILTAAHCLLVRTKYITAILGTINLEEGIEVPGRRKIVHPEWDQLGNDIGLLEIDSISYSDTIKAINLPLLSDLDATFEGHITVVSGWGATKQSIINHEILQYTDLLVISNTACAKANALDVGKGVLCATDPYGSLGCHGDSGGPLVDLDSENLIGIVSFGPTDDCSTIPFGTVFTRITSHRQWISDHTGI